MLKLLFVAGMLGQAVFFGIAAYVNYRKKTAWLAACGEFRGEVIAFKQTYDRRHGQKYLQRTVRPVIKYQALDGRVVTFENRQARSHWPFQVGDRIDIVVHRDDPTDAEVKGPMAQWFIAIASAFISILLIILALFILSLGDIPVVAWSPEGNGVLMVGENYRLNLERST